jgi:hypothetical protein
MNLAPLQAAPKKRGPPEFLFLHILELPKIKKARQL